MIIVFCSPKGGVGKSTCSILLAAALARAGHSVSIRDLDPDGTATRSAARFGLTLTTSAQEGGIQIVDTPPSLSHSFTQDVIGSADLVVNVLTLDPADLEKLPAAIPLLTALASWKAHPDVDKSASSGANLGSQTVTLHS